MQSVSYTVAPLAVQYHYIIGLFCCCECNGDDHSACRRGMEVLKQETKEKICVVGEDKAGQRSRHASSDSSAETRHNDDGQLVGTARLLIDSPNIVQPTAVNKPIPVPSVYQDGRGEIHNLLVGDKRINLLYTRMGVMRSGDIHANTQHDFIFEGQVEVWMLQRNGSTAKQVYGPYSYIQIPPYVPHIFSFLEDTVMAEWWEPEPFRAWFYLPYRRLVDESFVSTSQSKLVKLIEEQGRTMSDPSYCVWTTTALTIGLVLGIMIGRWK